MASSLRAVVLFILGTFFWCHTCHASTSSSSSVSIQDQWERAIRNRVEREEQVLNKLSLAGTRRAHHPHAKVIDTLSFGTFLDSSPVCLVAFFDPKSLSFAEVRWEIDRAAAALAALQMLPGTRIGMVNARLDPYLQFRYAKEMTLSWQGARGPSGQSSSRVSRSSRAALKRFRFGGETYYPTILKLFINGTMVEEYTEAIETRHILNYLKLVGTGEGVRMIETEDQLVSMELPLVVTCTGSQETLSMMEDVSKRLRGRATVGKVRSKVTCDRLFKHAQQQDVEECKKEGGTSDVVWIVTADEIGKVSIRQLGNVSQVGIDALMERIRSLIDPLFRKLTPDNSWKYLRSYENLAILFFKSQISGQPDEREMSVKMAIEDVYEQMPKMNKSLVAFVQADGEVFGGEFDIKQFPTLTMYQSKSAQFSSFPLWGDDPIDKDKLKMFLLDTIKWSSEPDQKITGVSDDDASTQAFVTLHSMIRRLMLAIDPVKDKVVFDKILGDFLDLNPITTLSNYKRLVETIWTEERMASAVANSASLEGLKSLIESFSDLHQVRESADSLIAMLNRTIDAIDEVYLNHLQVRGSEFLKDDASLLDRAAFLARIKPLPRVDTSQLSMKEFMAKYSKGKLPVIITELRPFPEGKEWSLESLATRCSKTVPRYMTRDSSTKDWGGLVQVTNENVTLGEFLRTWTTNATRKTWYIHDNPIAWLCPELFGPPPFADFIMPRYVAGDYFQRAAFDAHSHSWPSLFVGAEGTRSELHLDSAATSFAMFLVKGEKEWIIVDRTAIGDLYMDLRTDHFACDSALWDFLDGDDELWMSQSQKAFPLLTKAVKEGKVFRGFQREGEFVFIPGNSPHAVRNLQDSIGWSINVVDAGNYIEHLRDKVMTNKFSEFETFTKPEDEFPQGMSSVQRDLTFGEFKSQRWSEMVRDIR